jgi:hypothetical protein
MAVETPTTHVYEVRPLKDGRVVDLIADALPFGKLWYSGLLPSATQLATQNLTAALVLLSFAFSMRSAIWSKRMSRRENLRSHEAALRFRSLFLCCSLVESRNRWQVAI